MLDKKRKVVVESISLFGKMSYGFFFLLKKKITTFKQ